MTLTQDINDKDLKELLNKKSQDRNLIVFSDLKNNLHERIIISRNQVSLSSCMITIETIEEKKIISNDEKNNQTKRITNKTKRKDKNNYTNCLVIYPSIYLETPFKVNQNGNIKIFLSLIKPLYLVDYIDKTVTNDIVNPNKPILFGLVTAYAIEKDSPSFQLFDNKSSVQNKCSVEYYKIIKSKKINVTKEFFQNMIFVYEKLFSNFLNDPKSWISINYERLISNTHNERKYFITPVKNESEVEFDLHLFQQIISLYKDKVKLGKNLNDYINNFFNSNLNLKEDKYYLTDENKKEVAQLLDINLFYNTVKLSIIDLKDIISSYESSTDFFDKSKL